VILSDLDAARCEAAADALRGQGRQARALVCDMRDSHAIGDMARAAIDTWGRLDTLVCNAAAPGPVGPIGNVSRADWDVVMGVNLAAPLALSACVIPHMAGRGGGSVVLMSSIAGLRGNRGIGLYGLSKAGLAQLARNLAVEWGPSGVRVNAVSPGLIRTPFATDLLSDEVFMARRLAATPLRRVGEPDEVAGVVVMLVSRAGAFITGHNLVIDGGTTVSDGS
jgi:NAD(P)-dependent dehydrogenase (short-subunit alcohol dehydrogenase family)